MRRITRRNVREHCPQMYHQGMRKLQDQFDSRRIADRLEQVTVHKTFTESDRSFIEQSAFFFIATTDAQGSPECSYKGGLPGFVRILDDRTLAFPDYDGNGMFRSLGNILANPRIGLLFINFEDPDRLRINGLATVHRNDPLASTFPDAKLVIRVKAQRIFPNCPRYIHEMKLMKYSVYAPHRKYVPPVPEWKKLPEFKDALPHESEH